MLVPVTHPALSFRINCSYVTGQLEALCHAIDGGHVPATRRNEDEPCFVRLTIKGEAYLLALRDPAQAWPRCHRFRLSITLDGTGRFQPGRLSGFTLLG